MQALSKLGKDSVPLLAKALEEEPKSKGGVLSAISRAVLGGEPIPDRREWLADALGKMGDDAKPAVPALKRLLKHKNSDVRNCSAIAFGKIAGDAEVVPVLTAILETVEGDNIHIQSLQALARIGPPAKTSLPAIRKLALSENEEESTAAKEAIEAIVGE